ncbi:MAG: glycosyltransferase, partial [Tannerella sp.]|nr:glycosyltransferase [Tannerella sp.]
MPIFSIIIPTFNAGQTFQKCLESVVNQSFTNFEVLIMDGLSTDNTAEIATGFKDSRIRIFSEKDDGIYDAMNKGIDSTKGEWLYFLGSDDTISDHDVLQKVYEAIKETGCKIIYGNIKADGDNDWVKNGEIYDGPFNFKKLASKNICHQAIFYHKTVFKSVGNFNTTYKTCSDYDFNLKCYAKYKFRFINIIVANYFAGGTSSKSEDVKMQNDKWKNIVKYYKWYWYKKEFSIFNPYIRSLL